jgi:ubiquinone/menaquinone biosynthesis C-methylase UbiE
LKQSDYVLGHTDRERLRLIRQARVLASITEHFLRESGIVSGMRVLDIGCGVGDVAMLVAQLVGPQGKVVSIDLDQGAIVTARNRAAAVGLDNATFRQADISTYNDAEPFDAIVGRSALEFLPDPVVTIRRLSGLLRPGGIMAFQEPSWKIWLAYTAHLPLRMAITTIIRDVFAAGGVNTEMELPLYQGFLAANLMAPQLRVAVPMGDGPEFRSLLHDLLLSVWARAEALQVELLGGHWSRPPWSRSLPLNFACSRWKRRSAAATPFEINSIMGLASSRRRPVPAISGQPIAFRQGRAVDG